MKIRVGSKSVDMRDKPSLRLINEEFTSKEAVTEETRKIAEERQNHNDDAATEAKRQTPEGKKLDRRLDLAAKASIYMTAVALGASGLSSVYNRIVHANPVPRSEQVPNMNPQLKPLKSENVNTAAITLNAESLRHMPSVDHVVEANDTPGGLAHDAAPQFSPGTALNDAEQSAIAPYGSEQLPAEGATISLPTPPDFIQPNPDGQTVHINLK
jgi:hypothetical protein